MRLSILLFALGKILKIASLGSKKFKWYIRKADARILIRTEGGKHARLFRFNKGKFSSHGGDHADFDVALTFKDAATGFAVLTSKEKDASFNAAADGKLKVEGMSFYAQWFEDGTKLIM